MKKTLVALAALAATSAFAQVTMYGSIDVANVTKQHTNVNGTIASKTTGIGEGFNAGNRIGFRGTEDLGGGAKVNFVIEQGINITNGALFSSRAAAGGQQLDGISAKGGWGDNMPAGAYSTGTNRQSFVSYAAGFGEIRAGYQYTNLYTVSTNSGYHLGSEQPGGDLAHGTFNNAAFGGTRANGLTYISPRFSGVQATLQMGAGSGRETADIDTGANSTTTGKTKDTNKRTGILLNYTNGPLNASFAHTEMNIEGSLVTANTTPTTLLGGTAGKTLTATTVATDYSNKLDQLAGSYQLGAAKLTASYAKGQVRDAVTATNNANTKATQLGAEYAFGQIRPFFITGKLKADNTTGTALFDAKSSMFGARYDLSKRTLAYVMSGKVKDDTETTATKVNERKAMAIGLYHSF